MHSNIQFQAQSTCDDLQLVAKFDGQEFFSQQLTQQPQLISYQFADDVAPHCLELVLLGKTDQHTQLDSQGNIAQDQVIKLSDFYLDDINIDQVFWQHSRYTHDFNGHSAPGQHQFYGVMGCNGTVRFDFSSPLYLWLLENI